MDQFAWTKSEALYYMGVLMSVGAVVACATFVGINPICKIWPERKVMLWGGFFLMVIGRALYIPWGDGPPIIYDDSFKTNLTAYSSLKANCDNATLTDFINTTMQLTDCATNYTELVGCPSSQLWCSYTPSMTISQFILGYALTVVGYPIGVTLIQTIFSKILGPRPQVRIVCNCASHPISWAHLKLINFTAGSEYKTSSMIISAIIDTTETIKET